MGFCLWKENYLDKIEGDVFEKMELMKVIKRKRNMKQAVQVNSSNN